MNLEMGDVCGSRDNSTFSKISLWLQNHLVTPEQDRTHFFILWQKLEDDWLILESIPRGISVGKLSWYADQDIIFYRVDCDKELREQAPYGLINYGRASYDFPLIIRLVLEAIPAFFKVLVREKRIRRFTARDFTYNSDRALICTEAVEIAYLSVGVAIVDPEILPIPQTFREAEIEGRLIRIS